ncbi:hypothetical protein DEA8626_02737 [Defluviimonas aquaemixtae]|uniref:Uncharacterized protein n=1 Tax=Albidovulum aquaemixtae TaxID=1542388 RepID=A0A2R8BJU0_9RHOB|nr:hypothetical protein [Defluviimonas aquaemixtae]SPH23671.1 hypothetical protein DEA8626_02737 [Defluviimonas aquaemixtae]
MALAVAATGLAAAFTSDRIGDRLARIDRFQPEGPGPLDGMSFNGVLGPDGQPKDVEDTFVFANGTFVSKECELRCDYPARPYKAQKTDGGWRSESITRFPDKDATITWRETVESDRIEGTATWKMRRWYWSIEREFAFEARLNSAPRLIAEDR